MISAPPNVLNFETALALMREQATGLASAGSEQVAPERLRLLACVGRVLAEDVRADRDQPPFDRSTRDGFAIRSAEFNVGEPVRVAGMVRAGERWSGPPAPPGEAIEIMTGAPLPGGADAVAMIEHVVRTGASVAAQAGRSWKPGENIVPRGSEARAGEIVLPVGTVLGAAEIALAASSGRAELNVFRRPRVAIVATGDELVEVGSEPVLSQQQIWNSNSYGLAAMVANAGGEAVRLPITPDVRESVATSLRTARECDLIVLSGGVSMGQYDLVEEMLLEAGAEFFLTGVRMQPGKPVVFGRLPAAGKQAARFFFGLPGNPISTQVTFHCFVEPFLRTLAGAGVAEPRWALARLAEPAEPKIGLTRLLPGRMEACAVRIVGWQGSGDLAANARANCYVELPAGHGMLGAGNVVRVLLR
jgi:molybdopterin molybdotransferase